MLIWAEKMTPGVFLSSLSLSLGSVIDPSQSVGVRLWDETINFMVLYSVLLPLCLDWLSVWAGAKPLALRPISDYHYHCPALPCFHHLDSTTDQMARTWAAADSPNLPALFARAQHWFTGGEIYLIIFNYNISTGHVITPTYEHS